MLLDFLQVDAFSHRPLYGNPAAVVFDADNLSTEMMQKIAREMNLSETVFILKPTDVEADYRVRIFTPMSEMAFAGHPTVAAAYSVLLRYPDKSNSTLLKQECGIGLVPVEVLPGQHGNLLKMTQGEPVYRESGLEAAIVARMLGCAESDLAVSPFQVVSTGVQWLIVQLAHFPTISKLVPDQSLIMSVCKSLRAAGVTVFVKKDDHGPIRYRLRTFAPGEGVTEDPVCGSGNGSVAAYIARNIYPDQQTGSYLAEQGVEIARDGLVHVSFVREGDRLKVMVGGEAAVSASGKLHLPK